jgi:type II secretory pathway pseudopilin PulG
VDRKVQTCLPESLEPASPSAGSRPCGTTVRFLDGCIPIGLRRGSSTPLGAKRRNSLGFTYIGLLLLVAMMGIALTVVSQVWQTMQKREKEDELLFIGDQMRRALALYAASAAGGQRYPQSLEELLKDPRYPAIRRYLRKIDPDPITGRADWGLVKGPGDAIMGVYSLSEDEPLKKDEFRFADRDFEGKTKYSEWVFIPRSSLGRAKLPPGTPPK